MTDSGRRDQLVQSQYEGYPYPERNPADEKKRMNTGSPSNLAEVREMRVGADIFHREHVICSNSRGSTNLASRRFSRSLSRPAFAVAKRSDSNGKT